MFDFFKKNVKIIPPKNLGKLTAKLVFDDESVEFVFYGCIECNFYGYKIYNDTISADTVFQRWLKGWKNQGFLPVRNGRYLPFSSLKEISTIKSDYYKNV